MMLDIIPLAQRDIAEVARYYREERDGLDSEFLAEVDEIADRITNGPLRYEQIRPGIRRCLMDRFPCGIYFRMQDKQTVRIIAVVHHSRRPGFGLRRK